MLTALLTGLAVLLGVFAERIVFAVLILLLARWVSRRIRRLLAKGATKVRGCFARLQKWLNQFRHGVRYAVGPTIRVVA
jgi:hypothetical protein